MSKVMMVGECLVGDGNEVAHIDLLIGPKDGPVGQAFAASLVNQTDGFTSLLSLVTPNLPAKPDTIMTNKVTIKGADQDAFCHSQGVLLTDTRFSILDPG